MLLREGKTHLFTRPADDVYSSSVVYISDDFALARSYAALFPNSAGDVYEVTPSPTSSLRVDDDLPAASLSCAQALIVSVAERAVCMTVEEWVMSTAQFMTWEDGRSMYTSDGHMNVAPEWPLARPQQLAALGVWLPWQALLYDGNTGRCFVNPKVMSKFRINLGGGRVNG